MSNKIRDFLQYVLWGKQTAQRIYNEKLLPRVKPYAISQINKHQLQNILHVNTIAGKGGAAKVAHHNLNVSYNLKGYNSKVLVNEISGVDNDNIELLEKNISPEQKMLLKYQKKHGWLDFFYMPSLEISSQNTFKECDILHFHNLHGGYFSPFALPELTALKPTVWTLHDEQSYTGHCAFTYECNEWETGCKNCKNLRSYPKIKKDCTSFLFKTKKRIYENSDFTVVCPSMWLKQRAERSILKDKDIRLIYNGVDEKIFKNTDKIEARKKINLPLDKKIMFFSAFGSIKNPQKGGKYLIETYKQFKDRDDVVFLNAGGNEANSKDNWIDIPYISDEAEMALYYSASDLFIFPSMADNCPLTVLESLSCGTPVITFNTGGIPELVEHLKTGYIANYKDADDFISGVKIFLDNDELRQNAGIEARAAIERSFTLDTMVNNYLELYQEVFNKRKSM